jgi:pilus assembly protein CpaD
MKLAALLALAAPLAACTGADRVITNKIDVHDVRAQHPIELAQGRVNLDVIPLVHGGDIDARTQAQLRQFAEGYHERGSGDIAIALPQGGPGAAAAHEAMPAVRKALVAGGARGYVVVSNYPVVNPALASPIRLSYSTIVAQTRSRCGQWPSDLASGSSVEGWDNKAYWNFGCSTQQMLAAQAAEPRDLLGPAAEAPIDAHMRGRGIEAVRNGRDPGTGWATQNSNIGGIGN